MFHGCWRAFDETVRTRSIRKASEALGVAPSSVSRHIAILEREMGTRLFVRHADGVELTHAGSLVADYVRHMLVEFDTLRTDLDDLRGTQRRLVRLAVVESIASSGPMKALRNFTARYPDVSFNIRLMPAPQVLQAVKDGQCEIGLTYCADPDMLISKLASISEPVMLAVPDGHALQDRSDLSLKEIAEYPLGLPDRDFGVRKIIDRVAASASVELKVALSSNDFETLRSFVKCGAGLALLPLRAISRQDAQGIKAIEIHESDFETATIDLIVLRDRRLPRVLKAFVDELTAEIEMAIRAASSGHGLLAA
jgi:DNA-binding transcriptional LysR family regulator